MQPLTGIGNYQLCGAGRGWRAQVSHEIRDREVDLVADAGHDWNRAAEYRARHALVVEGPQILERAAAARDNQHIALCARSSELDRGDQRWSGGGALYGGWIDQYRSGRKAARQNV